MRHSVIVIPHSDAESSVIQCMQLASFCAFSVFSGFRIGVRNDDFRVPHLTLILYDFIIVFSSNRFADEPKKYGLNAGVTLRRITAAGLHFDFR